MGSSRDWLSEGSESEAGGGVLIGETGGGAQTTGDGKLTLLAIDNVDASVEGVECADRGAGSGGRGRSNGRWVLMPDRLTKSSHCVTM